MILPYKLRQSEDTEAVKELIYDPVSCTELESQHLI